MWRRSRPPRQRRAASSTRARRPARSRRYFAGSWMSCVLRTCSPTRRRAWPRADGIRSPSAPETLGTRFARGRDIREGRKSASASGGTRLRVAEHRPQKRRVETATTAASTAEAAAVAAAARENERARVVERQRRDVADKRVLRAGSIQILLNVREVERGDDRVVRLQVRADRAYGFRSTEVADDGDEEIARFEIFHHAPVLFRREKSAIHA